MTGVTKKRKMNNQLVGSSSKKIKYAATKAANEVAKKDKELKGVDTEMAINEILNAIDTNDDVFVVNAIRAGTGSFERVGRKIAMKYLYINAVVTHTYKGSDSLIIQGNLLRMVVVYDKQPSGVTPVFSAIFGERTNKGVASSDFLAPRNYDNMSRFQVIHDKIITSNPMTTVLASSGGANNKIHIKEYIKLGNRETVYSDTNITPTIAQISSGALYIYFRAMNKATNVNVFKLDAESSVRLRYTD